MFEVSTIFIIFITFLVAGTVKGVIGLGLPTISLAVLTVALDLHSAMALLLVPSIVTSVWQGMTGGYGKMILRRLWLFLLVATVTVWVGGIALTRVELPVLAMILGGLLIVYALLNLGGARFTVAPRHEGWVGVLVGAANGVLTGMTGSSILPGVMFLQAIGLSRDVMIQAMGILFALSTIALALALQGNRLLTGEHVILSVGALVPALVGMTLGQKLRKRLSERAFRRLFFLALLLLGLYIIANAY